MQELANNLRRYIVAKRVSQNELARRTKDLGEPAPQSSISRVISGKQAGLSWSAISGLAQVMGVSADDLCKKPLDFGLGLEVPDDDAVAQVNASRPPASAPTLLEQGAAIQRIIDDAVTAETGRLRSDIESLRVAVAVMWNLIATKLGEHETLAALQAEAAENPWYLKKGFQAVLAQMLEDARASGPVSKAQQA